MPQNGTGLTFRFQVQRYKNGMLLSNAWGRSSLQSWCFHLIGTNAAVWRLSSGPALHVIDFLEIFAFDVDFLNVGPALMGCGKPLMCKPAQALFLAG